MATSGVSSAVEAWNPGAAIVMRGIETPQEFVDRPSYPRRAVRHSCSLSFSEPRIPLNKQVARDTKKKEFENQTLPRDFVFSQSGHSRSYCVEPDSQSVKAAFLLLQF